MNPLKLITLAVKTLLFPSYRFLVLAALGYYDSMNDEEYLKLRFKHKMGRELDLENPKTFNEKLQWLKLYDHRPEYTEMVDKYSAKKFIADKIGDKYVIPTLGRWEKFDDIDFDQLPPQFVLKCTHDCGTVFFVRDKSKFNMKSARRKFTGSLKKNYYMRGREWVYKNIKPAIIAEEYLENVLAEYKIFCFDGRPGLILVCKGRGHSEERTNDFYDLDFNHIPVTATCKNSPVHDTKPAEYDEMINIASKLSAGIPQVRIDLYLSDDRKIYAGEITFFHDGGTCAFKPKIYDEKFGAMITLPPKTC